MLVPDNEIVSFTVGKKEYTKKHTRNTERKSGRESEREREKCLLVGPPIAFVIVDIIVIAINIIAICNAICVVLISGDCVSVYRCCWFFVAVVVVSFICLWPMYSSCLQSDRERKKICIERRGEAKKEKFA